MSYDPSLQKRLYKILKSAPDKHFLDDYIDKNTSKEEKKRQKGSFLSSILKSKEKTDSNIVDLREQIKAFHNSFKSLNQLTKKQEENVDKPDTMTLSQMNDFRKKVKRAAEKENEGFNYRALDAIVTYIDLRNSGVTSEKQNVLEECLIKIGNVLISNGGLSMFHTSWFLSIYREYIIKHNMFPRGILNNIDVTKNRDLGDLVKKMKIKERELRYFLQLVSEKEADVRRVYRLSKDPLIKMSHHGHKGCSFLDISRIFTEHFQSKKKKAKPGQIDDVKIIMAYAMLFSRIPMLHLLVEKIVKSIPNINLVTNLYQQKIVISQKVIHLNLSRDVYRFGDYASYAKKLQALTTERYNYCDSIIRTHGLQEKPLIDEVYAYPFIKQAYILLAYKDVLMNMKEKYLDMLHRTADYLNSIPLDLDNCNKQLVGIFNSLETYQTKIKEIIKEIKKANKDATES